LSPTCQSLAGRCIPKPHRRAVSSLALRLERSALSSSLYSIQRFHVKLVSDIREFHLLGSLFASNSLRWSAGTASDRHLTAYSGAPSSGVSTEKMIYPFSRFPLKPHIFFLSHSQSSAMIHLHVSSMTLEHESCVARKLC
jgi:hypothetical protein